MTSPTCLLARPGIVVAAAEGRELAGPLRRHRDRCLPCRAAAARTATGIRILRTGSPSAAPPADLERRIVEALGRRPGRLPLVPLAVVIAGVAAGIVGLRKVPAGIVGLRKLPAAP